VKRFTVLRDQDAWLRFGPFSGWWWEPTGGEQIDLREYLTKWGAWLAGWRATRNDSKEQR